MKIIGLSRSRYLEDFSGVDSFGVRIEFTDRSDPSQISGRGLAFVSLLTEILANTLSRQGARLRELYGRIPYGAPLYLWEVTNPRGTKLLYIGQAVAQPIQKRFEGHSALVRLLARYVNESASFVYYRLCSRLDVVYVKDGKHLVRAIEHFPPHQARRLIDDIEAYLIYRCQPVYNTQYKKKERHYWKPFSISQSRNISVP